MSIEANIKRLRLKAGLTQEQLADKLEISRSTVTQWETGWSSPRMGMIEKLSTVFGVSKSELVEDREKWIQASCENEMVNVPLLGSIAAGEPIEMDAVDDVFPISRTLYTDHPNSFLLHVEGESMNKRIPNGSLVLIDKDDCEPKEGAPFAVCVNGYDATIKKLRPLANGIELVPDSWDVTYRPKQYDFSNPEDEEITIIGRVVWMTAPFDYEI